MSEKLKPCPFCGGAARVKDIQTVNHVLDRRCIQCTRCGAQSAETPVPVHGSALCETLWNRRDWEI